jgi:hypothetical protein
MINDKQKYIYIGLGFLIFFIYLALVFFLLRTKPAQQASPVSTPSPTVKPREKLVVHYDKQSVEKLQKTLSERRALSASDQAVRRKILAPFTEKGGVVIVLKNARVEYVKTADLFQGEITTIDIARAKRDVVDWFIDQGISKEGICDLPLMFYLSQSVSSQLAGRDLSFSPIPDSC